MILEEETKEAFGYYTRDLSHKSGKLIIAACELCRKFRVTPKFNYYTFCGSCANKGVFRTEETKALISAAQKGRHHTKETKALISISAIKRMHNNPPAMTAPEKAFEAICNKYDLPFICNVNAKKHIGSAIPDFIHISKKIVVEVFGDYFHSVWSGFKGRTYNKTVEGRTKQLKAEGYNAIVLWESDLMREDTEKYVISLLRKRGII